MSPKKPVKTLRLDQAVIVAAACILVGFLLGLFAGNQIWQSPVAVPGPTTAPAPAVAPPASALGSFSAEIRELKNIVDKDPTNHGAWTRLGNLYFDTDQFTDAIDAYTKALELEPQDPDVITDRAIMYRRIGDFEKAVSELKRAMAMDPKHLNAPLNLGVVLRYDLNDVPGAIQAWQAYLSRNPPAEMAEKIRREIESLKGQGQ